MSPAPAFSGSASFRTAPLQASGLPPRILTALRAGGAVRLGDLCRPPPAIADLPPADRALLDRVVAWWRAACLGHPPRLTLAEWLALFLSARLVTVLQLHYGLHESGTALSLHEARLSATGRQLGLTRERVRQLIAQAFGALYQTLPLFAAEPILRAAEKALESVGGVLDAAALAQRTDRDWQGISPVGAFLLLAQLRPGRITIYRGFFSVYSDTLLDRVEKALRDRLDRATGLLPISEIAASLSAGAPLRNGPAAEPLLQMLLRHLPDAIATRDGRAGLAARHGVELLHEVLAATGEAPLRTLVEAFNARVHPECRRGSGFVRDMLLKDPRIRKTAPGRYALPGGLQTGLAL